MKRRPRLSLVGVALGAAAALAGALLGCGEPSSPDQQNSPASAALPAAGPVAAPPRADEPRDEPGFLGVILPRQSVDVASEVEGRLLAIHVREGDRVRRGGAIATLDRAQIQRDLEMAQAGLRAAEAEVARRRVELKEADNRLARRLSIPESFPREEIQQAELQKQAAQADLDSALARTAEQRARVAQTQGRVARSEVRAPADGTVSRRYLEPGALAGPGQPIVRLISAGDLIVRFAVPPERARSLTAGQRVEVEVEGTALPLPATLEQVSPEVDPPSGMVLLVASLGSGARVQPGSTVRVHFQERLTE